MNRTSLTRVGFFAAFLFVLPVGTLAQEPPAPLPSPPANIITVNVGPYEFDVDGNEPLSACVTAREESLEGIMVDLQVMVRLETGDYVPTLAYRTRATAALANARIEQCFVLAAED